MANTRTKVTSYIPKVPRQFSELIMQLHSETILLINRPEKKEKSKHYMNFNGSTPYILYLMMLNASWHYDNVMISAECSPPIIAAIMPPKQLHDNIL